MSKPKTFHEVLHTAASLIPKVKFQKCQALHLPGSSPIAPTAPAVSRTQLSSWAACCRFITKPWTCADGEERRLLHLHLYLCFPERECHLSQPLPGADSSLPFASRTAAGARASLRTPLPTAPGQAESRAAFHSRGPTATAGL